VVSGLYTLGAIISIFGLYVTKKKKKKKKKTSPPLFSFGAIVRGRRMVSLFATALAIHLGFHIVSGAYSLYVLFHTNDDQELQDCQNKATSTVGLSSNNTVTLDACKAALKIAKGISVAAFVLVCLIELCPSSSFFFWSGATFTLPFFFLLDGVIIAHNYAEQLDEQESADYPKYNTTPYMTNNYYNSQAALVQNRA
jgi:hypothetical protein